MKLHSLTAALLFAAATLIAGDAPQAKPASAEFERMKSLVGTWQGKTDMGQGPIDLNVTYRVIAAGSVVEQRDFVGTPNEMVTMYYDKDGKLSMTHYCMLGNRPAMALKASDANSLTFDFDSCCGIDPKKESHMHALTLRFDDANTITSTCQGVMEGKGASEHSVTLKRVAQTTASLK